MREAGFVGKRREWRIFVWGSYFTTPITSILLGVIASLQCKSLHIFALLLASSFCPYPSAENWKFNPFFRFTFCHEEKVEGLCQFLRHRVVFHFSICSCPQNFLVNTPPLSSHFCSFCNLCSRVQRMVFFF